MPAPTVSTSIVTDVTAWYLRAGRPLPWREAGTSPWGVLVSEVMSQQTPVARVIPQWHAWLDMWPTPAALAQAATADVLRAWGRLGYPRRALRLQECARVIVERHAGEVPQDEAALLALPGVGDYTAAAVLAFAFGRRACVLDTNVRRVIARAIGGTARPAPHLGTTERQQAEALLPDDDAAAATWAAASMELGALVCTARTPHCIECPIAGKCAWRAADYPPDEHAALRRTQNWHGTDRQVRGQVMALLREWETISHDELSEALRAPVPGPGQLDRCLTTLVADGLAAHDSHSDRYRLP